jgi:hypothetical protein
MNNAYAMIAPDDSRKNQKASLITAGFAGLMILMMFLLKWEIPAIEKPIAETGIDVQLNLPEEPIVIPKSSGGGGGGNPVQAAGAPGVAPHVPPTPGDAEDAKDIEENKEKESPPILKPDVPKPNVAKINSNNSVVKAVPKPIIETPAPPRPKAVIGKTLSGTSTGGNEATTYDRAGGRGPGNGVGDGPGSGGNKGGGTGGGNGPGNGPGTGPKVTRGDRRIVSAYAFQGDLDKATVYADITVSPDGIGQFNQFSRGSTATSSAYRTAISQYLRNMRFDKGDHESVVTVQFNFRVTN